MNMLAISYWLRCMAIVLSVRITWVSSQWSMVVSCGADPLWSVSQQLIDYLGSQPYRQTLCPFWKQFSCQSEYCDFLKHQSV